MRRRVHRILLLAVIVAVAPVLAGCESFDSDKFDIFSLNEKKKLKGERKEVFPEGVPGVVQGLPPEYLNKQQSTAEKPSSIPMTTSGGLPNDKSAAPVQPSKTAAVEPAPEPKPEAKPKRKPKRKPKPHVAAHPTKPVVSRPAAPAQASDEQKPPPWPAQKPAQSSWPAQQGQGSSMEPWPTAPAPGTFSH
ncbi:MAG: hypothetical protein ACREB8_18255 [Pseudolabrys sp.]